MTQTRLKRNNVKLIKTDHNFFYILYSGQEQFSPCSNQYVASEVALGAQGSQEGDGWCCQRQKQEAATGVSFSSTRTPCTQTDTVDLAILRFLPMHHCMCMFSTVSSHTHTDREPCILQNTTLNRRGHAILLHAYRRVIEYWQTAPEIKSHNSHWPTTTHTHTHTHTHTT